MVVGALVWAGFRWGPEAAPRVQAWLSGEEVETAEGGIETSPELAEETLDRFERFRAGEGGERLSLGKAELTSVIRHALPGILPPGVTRPTVAMDDGRLHLSARVATGAFPDLPSLREVVGILPDTVDIDMRGGLVPFEGQRVALQIDRIHAARIPLPQRFIPQVLDAMGRKERSGLGENAMSIPLPEGIQSVYVRDDSLVMVANR